MKMQHLLLHGYLVVDCDPKSPRELKLRTNIFPGETTVCYFKRRKLIEFRSLYE